MSRNKNSYGFIEEDENPFDEPAPVVKNSRPGDSASSKKKGYKYAPPAAQPLPSSDELQAQAQARFGGAVNNARGKADAQLNRAMEAAGPYAAVGAAVAAPHLQQAQARAQGYADQAKSKYDAASAAAAPHLQRAQDAAAPYAQQGKVAYDNAAQRAAPYAAVGMAVGGAALAGASAWKGGNAAGPTPGGSGNVSLDDIEAREANLRAREEKMLAKEQNLDYRERQVAIAEGSYNNWPCMCMPVLYHNIKEDIPQPKQKLVKRAYFNVLFTWFGLLWNFVTVITIWGQSGDGSGEFIWSGIYFLLGVPGSWVIWYRPLYYGCKKKNNRKFLLFFLGEFLHIVLAILIAIGVPSMGTGGFLWMAKMFSGGYTVAGIFSLVLSICWVINFFLSIWIIKRGRDEWKAGGGSKDLERDMAAAKVAAKAAV